MKSVCMYDISLHETATAQLWDSQFLIVHVCLHFDKHFLETELILVNYISAMHNTMGSMHYTNVIQSQWEVYIFK